jgi:CheY-like chemotaxis protein/HPt (histidine-containing phosphotransfer) domain-containing protein
VQGGEQAIALLEEIDPALILMDIRMPGMSGIEAVKLIRSKPLVTRRRIPVIALSAGIDREEFNASPGDFDDFIPKPFEESVLIQSIVKLASRSGAKSPYVPLRIPVFSLEPLRENSNGNNKFFRDMVHLFLENTGKGLSELEALIANGQVSEVSELAHKISAPCKHLKAEKLYSQLKIIERDAPNGQDRNVSAAILEARAEFEAIREAILSQPEFKTD